MNKKLLPLIIIVLVGTVLLAACAPTAVETGGAARSPSPSATAPVADRPADAGPTEPPADDPEATATARVAAIIVTVAPRGKVSSNSPDGRWRAEVWRYDCIPTSPEEETAYEELRLMDTRSGQSQVIATQLQYCGGLGAAGLGDLDWSRNGRYLYFSTAAEGTPDGGCGYFQLPLTAYELETGATTELAQGPHAPGKSAIAFWRRPTGEGPVELAVWELETGEERRFGAVEAGWYRGPIAWSPDGSQLAFLESEQTCNPAGGTVLAIVDLSSGKTREVLRSEDPRFTGLEWTEPGGITLKNDKGLAWWLDLDSGELEAR